jgi:hypothetical protein
MKTLVLCAGILLLLSSSALGQSYEMTIHLSSGQTVTIPHDAIQRIEFTDVATGVQDPADPGQAPQAFQLLRNYPNPFNPATTIAYAIPTAAEVTVRIHDAKGALIKELLHATQSAGPHQLNWDGTDSRGALSASGVYFAVVECGQAALSQQLILVK